RRWSTVAARAPSSAGRGSGRATDPAPEPVGPGGTICSVDLLYLAQWVGCLAALTGGTAVLWLADQVPARSHPLRWAGTALTVLLLVAVLGLWLATAGDAAAPTLVDRAARLSDGVHLVALTFLVLFHTVAAP